MDEKNKNINFNWDNIYKNIKKDGIETESQPINKKYEKLLSGALTSNVRALFYSSAPVSRSVEYSILSLFDKGTIQEFINNEREFISLTKKLIESPKEIYINKEKFIEKYSPFYKTHEFDKWETKEIEDLEFINIINKQINNRFKKIKMLAKTASDYKRETGNWRLYIAWPFIVGSNDKNKLRTPLMWQAIDLEERHGHNSTFYTIRRVDNKFKINDKLIQSIYADKNERVKSLKLYFNNIDDVFKEYYNHKISFKGQQLDQLKGLKKKTKKEYKEYISNTYKLENIFMLENILYMDEVFHDLSAILKKNKDFSIPEKNRILFSDKEEKYQVAPSLFNIDKPKAHALSKAIDDSTIIWGPPGTGKSEIITTLLVKLMGNSKRVVVVAEKDTALTVLQDRLKKKYNLNEFTLKMNGNFFSKKVFWKQVKKVTEIILKTKTSEIHLPERQDEFMDTLNKYHKFKNALSDQGIDDEEFWSINDKLTTLINNFDKFKTTNKLPSEFIGNIKKNANKHYEDKEEYYDNYKKDMYVVYTKYKDIEIKNSKLKNYILKTENINELKYNDTCISIARKKKEIEKHKNLQEVEILNNYNTKINDVLKREEVYNDVKEQYYNSLKPPVVFLHKSKIRYIDIIKLHKNSSSKKVFYFLANNEYGILKRHKKFKKYRSLVHEIITNANNYLKQIAANNFTISRENIEKTKDAELEKIGTIYNKEIMKLNIENDNANYLKKQNNEKINELKKELENSKREENIILNKLKTENCQNTSYLLNILKEMIENKFYYSWNDALLTKLNFIYQLVNRYNIDAFSDLHNEYQKNINNIKNVFKKANIYFKLKVIDNIKNTITSDDKKKEEFIFLHDISKLSTRKQPSPGSIMMRYLDIITIIFPIILSTPLEISKYISYTPNYFDYGIFDEASQMFLEHAYGTIHRCKKVIISGDSKQLSPSTWFQKQINAEMDIEKVDPKELSMYSDSLLEWGKQHYREVMLTNHYRSENSLLVQYSNKNFYDGRLKIVDSPYALNKPIQINNVHGEWQDSRNLKEVLEIIEILKNHDNNFKSIGVIAFNKLQMGLIIDRAEEADIFSYHDNNRFIKGTEIPVFIKNIENVQGDEAELIIFSIGYSSNDGSKPIRVGSHLTENRLNVAITRAIKKMIICKSLESHELKGISSNKKSGKAILYDWVKWLDTLEVFYKDQEKNISYKPKFRSPFEEQFYEILKKELPTKFRILTNNKFDRNYEIDLVIENISSGNKIAAIELDGWTYHNSLEQKEKDEEKTEFLIARGWNIIRVSSLEFWRDKVACVKRSIKRIGL